MSLQYDPISPVNSNITGLASTSGSVIDTNYDPSIYRRKYDMYGEDGQFESFNNSGGNLLAGIFSLIGNILNYFQQKKLLKTQQQYQYDYFDYTNAKQNAEYWKRVEYDSPSRQLQRLKDAGLNENLLYGSLGNVGQVAGNAPAASPGGIAGNLPSAMPFFDTGSVIQAFLQPSQLASQIALNKSQSFKNYKSAGVDEKTADRLSALTPLEAERMGHDIEQIMATKNYYEQLYGKISNENLAFDKYYQFIDQFLDAQLYDLQMSGSLKYSNIVLQTWQEEKILNEIKTLIPSQARLNNASAQERVEAAYRIKNLTPAEKAKIKADANLSEMEYDWYINNRVIAPLLMGVMRAF